MCGEGEGVVAGAGKEVAWEREREGRGRQRINAINLQLITHQLTPGQLVASEQPDNMQSACEPCVYIYIHARTPIHLRLCVSVSFRMYIEHRSRNSRPSLSYSLSVLFHSSLSDTYILRLVIRLSDCLSANRVHACKYTLTIRDVVKRRVYVVLFARCIIGKGWGQESMDNINETNVNNNLTAL